MLLNKIRWSTLPFFAKNLIISFGSITLIGVILIAAGYQFQKSILIQQLYDQAEVTTQKWSADLDTTKVLEAANEKSYSGSAQKALRGTFAGFNS